MEEAGEAETPSSTKKVSKAERIAEARKRARIAMAPDKAHVVAVKQKGTPAKSHRPIPKTRASRPSKRRCIQRVPSQSKENSQNCESLSLHARPSTIVEAGMELASTNPRVSSFLTTKSDHSIPRPCQLSETAQVLSHAQVLPSPSAFASSQPDSYQAVCPSPAVAFHLCHNSSSNRGGVNLPPVCIPQQTDPPSLLNVSPLLCAKGIGQTTNVQELQVTPTHDQAPPSIKQSNSSPNARTSFEIHEADGSVWEIKYCFATLLIALVLVLVPALLVSTLGGSSPVHFHHDLPRGRLDGAIEDTGKHILASSSCVNFRCPPGGVCDQCNLVKCSNQLYQVSESGDELCVLTKRANDTLEFLQSLLVAKTLSDQCSESPSVSYPLFRYSDLQLERPLELGTYPFEADVLVQGFVVDQDNEGGLLIGLREDWRLPYHGSCLVIIFFRSVLAWLGSFAVLTIRGTLTLAWKIVSSNLPLSFAVALAILVVYCRGSHQAKRMKVIRDVSHVRDRAYELLQDNSQEVHVVLHLRDQIGFWLHPNSKIQRVTYFNEHVWPRVVSDIRLDNRIWKKTQIRDGNPTEVWQWVAALASQKNDSSS